MSLSSTRCSTMPCSSSTGNSRRCILTTMMMQWKRPDRAGTEKNNALGINSSQPQAPRSAFRSVFAYPMLLLRILGVTMAKSLQSANVICDRVKGPNVIQNREIKHF
jgi:hypothetical protein